MSQAPRGQGSNSTNLRQFNERVILAALRRIGEASKADLARLVNLTDNTAGSIVRDLEAQQLVRVGAKRQGGRGQPATLLSLDADGAYAAGLKIGRRSMDAVLVDFCGSVLARQSRPAQLASPQSVLDAAEEMLAALLADVPMDSRDRIVGLGVAAPYNMGSWRRELGISAEACEGWNEFDIIGALASRTGMEVFGENDGTAAAVAELFLGHGRRRDDFIYVFIGAATGGGVVLGGDYLRGSHGNGGDIGLMPVPPSTLPTAPPPTRRWDILLTRASINALVRHLKGSGVDFPVYDGLEDAILRHPQLADEWLEDCADALTGPLLSAARTLDVTTVVLDGALPPAMLARLRDRTDQLLADSAPESRTSPELLLGKVGREAGAIGAALLPLHLNFSPKRATLVSQ
ncbi:hypothetical protein TSH100_20995 [Azospirillum sp. TSH100]|uniref:ROK family protein n=1 Tax=Azospirillum sp. TSH100 TaxID=652764 RepID=UPI000D61196A|nr:ROK family transcriptional regulator [Azospirillum sp. TSH100]PWC83325.1 hypothetical protein TSH100_20995 [Azospirillum sp. TSH100]QCG91084.1 ROK family transcriptional regulator [Azospirillum sp. TSH100]